jgi:HSP20 family protein
MTSTLTSTTPRSEKRPIILKFSDGDPFFQRMNDIYEVVARRAYELFEGRGRQDGHDLEDWLQAETELLNPMPVEVIEADGELIIRAETPGFRDKDIEVRVGPYRVMISGRREQVHDKKRHKTLHTEKRSDQVFRMLDLPEQVDPDKAKATLQEGALEIELPKAHPGKRIPVANRAA